MRILILTCNTGEGHNSCAKAIKQVCDQRGDTCDLADSLHFVSDKLSRFVSWGHVTMYRHIPGLFRAGYGFAEQHPALLEDDAAAYKLLTGGTKALYEYLHAGQYDAVICTHVFSALLLVQTMKEFPLSLKTVFVGTDYTCSPGTATGGIDRYFIPAAALTMDKAAAKRQFGIDPAHTHLLMMCGSMGCGPMEKLAESLSRGMDGDMELSIVCGTNEKLRESLQKQFGDFENIHIHGFVNQIGAMMDSADLYLTKPGGISVTEAAVKRLPMVLIDAVAGCEAHNLRFFTALGGAVTADDPKKLAKLCLTLLRDPEARAEMSEKLTALGVGNGAQCICDAMKEV